MHSSSSVFETNTILIVEDSPSNLMILSAILERQGAQVIVAATGTSGLQQAYEHLPDLILLDIHLPDFDGYQLCQKIRQDPQVSGIPIVFLSGLESPENKVKAFEMGGQDYITKPFHPQEVIVRVKQQLTNLDLQRQSIQKNEQLKQEIHDREQVIDELKRTQAEREKTQQALSSYINYVLLLQQITDAIRIQLTPEGIFNATVFQIGKAFEVNRCVLLTYDSKHLNYLPVVATFQNRPGPSFKNWIISTTANAFLQTVLSQNQAVVCPEACSNEYFYECGMDRNQLDGEPLTGLEKKRSGPDKTRVNDIESMLAVRISYQNKPTGVILLHQCDRPRTWTGQEMFRLTAIATHVGIALAQAQLLDNEKHQRSLLDTRNVQLRNEIQQRKLSEQALIQQSKELEEAKNSSEMANRAKSTFLANMSHELRTPLNAILGFSQVIENAENLTPEQHEHLSIISRCGNHLLELINGVLDMSKIESGQVTLSEDICDIHQLLTTLENIFQLKGQKKKTLVTFEISTELPKYVELDETKLRQILLNLLDNAVKFTDEGHVTLRLSVESRHSFTVDNHTAAGPKVLCLIFDIEDTGPGIAEEELSLLFQAFVQTESGKRYHGGTGLGLAISKEFSSLMGGSITVDSTLGKGTTFRVVIPTKTEYPSHQLTPLSNPKEIVPKTVLSPQPTVPQSSSEHGCMTTAIKRMPQSWIHNLRQAAMTGSDSKVLALVSEIPTGSEDLSITLTHWTNDFKFDEILNLIEQIEP